MLNNKGFTLIETLFVIAIMCILMSISINLCIPSKKIETSLHEIVCFINEAKLYAITSKHSVKIMFDRNMITCSSFDSVKNLRLEEGTYFDSYSLTFNASGHIKGAKRVKYHTQKKDYSFIFQIGSGYFYVE